jgi:hypothetical protein
VTDRQAAVEPSQAEKQMVMASQSGKHELPCLV